MASKQNILAGIMLNNNTNNVNKENNIDSSIGGGGVTANMRRPQAGQNLRTQQTTSGGGHRINSTVVNHTPQKQHKLKSRFTVIRKLGKGTYGKVQLAINKETGQEVAIKTIKKTKIENEQDLQRVKREIQIMSSIEHPHIIHIYEVFENKDKIVLIMQYAPGGELYEYVSQSKLLDDSEARRLFRQIATAIYYCHQNKICHRDLKLENILLDEKNNAKLADFGLSNVFDKSRLLKTFCGSPLYASPEIVQGSPYEGPEVDCWSLGVLLYTLVYGAMPFDGSNFKRLVKQISDASYYEPPQKSQASLLIGQLLCADPDKRATILDICSDPWVNGIMMPRSPRLSPSNDSNNQQQQAHASLLKVAQDMANLTPVRLDILLALALNSSGEQEKNPSEQQSSLIESKHDANKQTSGDTQQQCINATQNRQATLETMQIDDNNNRATSPVASYIVRDVDKSTPAKDQDLRETIQSIHSNKGINNSNDIIMSESVPDDGVHTAPKVDSKMEIVSDDVDVQAKKLDHSEKSTSNSATESENLAVKCEASAVNLAEASDSLMTLSSEIKSAEVVEEVAMDTSDDKLSSENPCQSTSGNQDESPTGQLDEKIVTSDGQTQLSTATIDTTDDVEQVKNNDDGDDDKKDSVALESEDKPKKVKKKIIIVKKKRKVPKKGDIESTTSTQPKEDIVVKNIGDSEIKQADDQDATKDQVKGPGKVRIPQTFQANASGLDHHQQVPPKTSATGRRQSALIADVSQKLLQQQLSGVSNSNLSEVDQQQLVGVRVTDKKNDFERRSSSAASKHPSPSPTNGETDMKADHENKSDSDVKVMNEPVECTGVDYQVVSCPYQQQTSVEPVERRESQTAQPIIDSGSLPTSEPLTPTGDKAELSNDINNRLTECAERLNAGDRSPNSPDATIGDDRSDSVDTIRAEILALESPIQSPTSLDDPSIDFDNHNDQKKIRSSLQINLGQAKNMAKEASEGDDESSIMSLGQPIGPAPIARSYKKVTFAKDGTCITETGRIYSTKGDDGTIRRIERKSKVTHYPSENANEIKEETHEEEVVYGNSEYGGGTSTSDHHSSTSRSSQSSFINQSPLNATNSSRIKQHPLERLILSSSNFSPSNDEYFSTQQQQQQQSPYDTAYQKRSRADSASSCSSESTDVFDDTFDTWTGAISMFNHHNRRLSELHESIISQAFDGSPLRLNESLFSRAKRDRRQQSRPQSGVPFEYNAVPSSASSQHRCGSVEPQFNFRGPPRRRQKSTGHRTSSEYGSGYDSDVPNDTGRNRPASALGARGPMFGSSNLFPRCSMRPDLIQPDDFFQSAVESIRPSNLLRDFEQEHEMLRHKMTKKLWRGSQPSLNDIGISKNESLSSVTSHQIRQSVPLAPGPLRRNLANSSSNDEYPPPTRHSMQTYKSSSKTSMITSQMSDMSLAGFNGQKNIAKTQHTASLIEVKRSPSKEQHLRTTQASGSNTITGHTGSSSTTWEDKITPTATVSVSSLNSSHLGQQSHQIGPSNLQESSGTRVRNWLQQSSDNLSVSSESKSSASETIASSGRSDQMYGKFDKQPDISMRAHQLPPAPNRSPNRSIPVSRSTQTTPGQVHQQASTSIRVLRSSSKKSVTSVGNTNDERQTNLIESTKEEKIEKTSSVGVESSERIHEQMSKASSEARLSRTVMTSPSIQGDLVHCDDDWPFGAQSRRHLVESVQNQSRRSHESHTIVNQPIRSERIITPSTTATYISQAKAATSDSFNWNNQSSASTNIEQFSTISNQRFSIFNDDLDDSLSGSGADLESRSSSSLLDQLRSRGYRSMISQRMVMPQPAISEVVHYRQHEEQSSQFATATSSATSLPGCTSGLNHYLTSASIVTSNTVPRPKIDSTDDNESQTNEQKEQLIIQNQQSLAGYLDRSNNLNFNNGNNADDCANSNHALELNNLLESNEFTKKSTQTSDDYEEQRQSNIQTTSRIETTIQELQPDSATSYDNCQENSSDELLPNSQNNINCDNNNQDVPAACCPNIREQFQQQLVEKSNHNENKPCSPAEQELDIDEDVREAKANIKEYLDRMRETEKFLKSLHEEEENQERQRQQFYLFNNLMLNTKLNGIRSATTHVNQSSLCESGVGYSYETGSSDVIGHQTRSAPIWPASNNNESLRLDGDGRIGFNPNPMSSSAIMTNPSTTGQHSNFASASANIYYSSVPPPLSTVSMSCFSSDLYQPISSYQHHHSAAPSCNSFRDTVKPMSSYNSTMTSNSTATLISNHQPNVGTWRRSRSQLGDHYSNNGYNSYGSNCGPNVNEYDSTGLSSNSYRRPAVRPLSASIDPITSDSNPYFPSRHRRSMSQMRNSEFGPVSSNFATKHRYQEHQPPMMSEYRSSFGPNLSSLSPARAPRSPSRRAISPSSPIIRQDLSMSIRKSNLPIEGLGKNADDSDSDTGMHAYRASSYVPKVIPEGGPTPRGRSRDFSRRYSTPISTSMIFKKAASTVDLDQPSSSNRASSLLEHDKPISVIDRRTSLQLSTSTSVTRRRKTTLDGESGDRSPSPIQRRRSLTGGVSSGIDSKMISENSRLTELEQRIQANKRRREELLSGNYDNGGSGSIQRLDLDSKSTGRTSSSRIPTAKQSLSCDNNDDSDEGDSFGFERPSRTMGHKDSSPERLGASATTTGSGSATSRCTLRTRPSRLESMEARIKRRSYCVRPSSPERSRSSSRWSIGSGCGGLERKIQSQNDRVASSKHRSQQDLVAEQQQHETKNDI